MASKAPGMNAGSEQSYAVDLPKDWTTRDTMMQSVKFTFIVPTEEDAVKGVSINILSESMNGASYDKYMEKSRKSLEAYIPGYKFLGRGTLPGNNIEWLHYSTTQNNFVWEAKVYAIQKNDIAYIMTAGAKEGEMAKYEATFDRIAQSFRLKD